MPSRRESGGYDLAWLQTLSLPGLQKLGKLHGAGADTDTRVEDMRVEELIDHLREDEVSEESDDDDEEGEAEYYDEVEKAVHAAPSLSTLANSLHVDEPLVKQDQHVDQPAPRAESEFEEANNAEVEGAEAEGAAVNKPWAAPPFVPEKSTKPPTQCEPFEAGQPGTPRDLGSLKSLEAASRKKEKDARKVEAAAARREAAATRRAKISGAFAESQANSASGPQRINNKARAAWEAVKGMVSKRGVESTQLSQSARRQCAVESARGK